MAPGLRAGLRDAWEPVSEIEAALSSDQKGLAAALGLGSPRARRQPACRLWTS